MATKMKFVLEVDDKDRVKVEKFGRAVDGVAIKGVKFGRKMKAAALGLGTLAKNAALAALKVGALGGAMAAGVAAWGIKKSVQDFAGFEVALNKIGNVSDRVLSGIKQKLMNIDPALGTATELARGYYQVLSAGITGPVESIKLLITASKLAKESEIEQAEVVKGLAALMRAYSGEVKTASDAADLLYTVEKKGITSVSELIPHIGNLANLSKAAGLNVNEMAAALAQATGSGAGTSIAVTQLMSLLRGLLKPTAEMDELMKRYGGSLKAIKQLGFAGVLELILQKTHGNADALLKLFGRAEAVSGVLQLTKGNMREYGAALDEMKNKTGAAESAWDRYKITLQSIWETFKNTVTNQSILIGEQLAPSIKSLVETVGERLRANRELITEKVSEWVGKIEIKVRTLIPKVEEWWKKWRNDLLPSLEKTGGILLNVGKGIMAVINAVGAVGKAIGWAMAKIAQFNDKVESTKKHKILTKLEGMASTVRPFMETMSAVEKRVQGFAGLVNRTRPTLLVGADTSLARQAVDSLVSDSQNRLLNLYKVREQRRENLRSSWDALNASKGTYIMIAQNQLKAVNDRIRLEEARLQSMTPPAGVQPPAVQTQPQAARPVVNHITLSPTFMTGDKASITRAIREINQASARLGVAHG